MSEKDDGGCAFPRDDYQTDGGPGQRGMSLRDWFAGMAMNQMLRWDFAEGQRYEDLAEQSYMAADALLLARSHREEKQ